MGGIGKNTSDDTYTSGSTIYRVTVSDDGKTYYLRMRNISGTVNEKYKIAYAKDDNKARIYVAPLKEYIYLNSDSNILKLLQNKRKGK